MITDDRVVAVASRGRQVNALAQHEASSLRRLAVMQRTQVPRIVANTFRNVSLLFVRNVKLSMFKRQLCEHSARALETPVVVSARALRTAYQMHVCLFQTMIKMIELPRAEADRKLLAHLSETFYQRGP